MSASSSAIAVLDAWWAALDRYQDKLPARGSIAAALHVLQRLRHDFQLDVESHVAGGEAQITGLSASAIKKLLAQFGETRSLSAVGGRSNRGARGDVAKLLEALRPLNLARLSPSERDECILGMQRHLVERYVSRYFSAKRVKAVFDPSAATSRFVEAILVDARRSGKAGPVAEHLVGAKLALRFPDARVRLKPFSTSDRQGGFFGDFELGTTVFHVTVTPMPELYEKLKTDLEQGRRVYLLVPKSQAIGAQQNCESIAAGQIAVEPIESFVATNVDELAEFNADRLKSGLRRLLEAYNSRIETAEIDQSLLIEIPPNLD